MKTQENKSDSLHEIIFENRNKQYGAYVIRKAYGDTVTKSLLITFSIVATVILGTVLYNKFTGKAIEKIMSNGAGQIDYVVEMNSKPLEQPKEPQKPSSSGPRANALATVINDHAEEPDEHTTVETAGNPTNTPTGPGTGTGDSAVAVITVREPAIVETAPVVIAEEMPELAGLNRFLSLNIVYPEKARMLGVEGTVYINFVVTENGSVDKIRVLKGIGGGCDEEAIRVVSKMPKWKPGKNAGKEVKVMFNLPIRFKLN